MKQKIIQRLQQGQLSELVTLGVNYLLQQPINELVDSSFVVEQIILALRTAAEGEQTERWARENLEHIQKLTPQGKPADHISQDVLVPLQELLIQPMALDLNLIQRLLDHKAVEKLFHDVLASTFESFASRFTFISSNSQKSVSTGFSKLRGWRDKALQSTPLGNIAQQIEEQIQQKTAEHVEKSVKSTLQLAAEHIASASNRELQGEYRLHLLDSIIQTNNAVYIQQLEEVGLDRIVATVASTIRAFLSRDDFQEGLQTAINQGLDLMGDKTLAMVLEESGLGDAWREESEKQIETVANQFVASEEFAEWLARLLD